MGDAGLAALIAGSLIAAAMVLAWLINNRVPTMKTLSVSCKMRSELARMRMKGVSAQGGLVYFLCRTRFQGCFTRRRMAKACRRWERRFGPASWDRIEEQARLVHPNENN